MSVVSPEHRAASVTPLPAVIGRRVADWLGRDDKGLRFAAALGAGLLAEIVAGLSALPPPALAFTPFVSFVAGLLFGFPGILGAALGQTLAGWMFLDTPWQPLIAALSSAGQGLCGYLVFRYVPGLGRGLPRLRSFLWFCGAALLGSLVSGVPAALAAPQGVASPQVWTGLARSLISVLVLAPPALLLADRFARRWMVRLPREAFEYSSSPSLSKLAGARGEETLIIEAPKPRRSPGPGLLKGGALVLGVTAVAVPLAGLFPRGGDWALLLYLIPILWSALRFGLRGGVLAASAGGFCFLTGLAVMIQGTGAYQPGALLVSDYAELLILILVGAIVGASSQEQTRLRDELLEYNRLLRRDLLRVAEALTGAIEAKDSYTEGHLRRVGEYAVAVGERLGLRGPELERLHYAGMLHDIGKLGVPEEVLRKAGPLDADEMEIMRRHPEIGARLLEKLDVLQDAAPIVLSHQERYDGARNGDRPGYPRGLSGEAIPLGARIIAVVDTFDAMTTTRPYREALSLDRALAVLRKERGRQFDPRVVDAFVEILEERPWRRM